MVDTVNHTSLAKERGSVDHLRLDQAAMVKDTANQTQLVAKEKDMEHLQDQVREKDTVLAQSPRAKASANHLLFLGQVHQVKVRDIVDLHLELQVKEKATANHLLRDQV